MGFLKKIFGLSETNNVHNTNEENVEINRPTDPEYQRAISVIPFYWNQYEESLRLIKNTSHCDTYFERKEFISQRLELLRTELNYVGGHRSFIDPMTNTDMYLTVSDIDLLISDIRDIKYDEGFIQRYCDSLDFKIDSLKTNKAKLNNIFKWQQWLKPYRDNLRIELLDIFDAHCKEIKHKVEINM